MDWEARYRNRDTPWLRPGLNPAFAAWFSDAAALKGQCVLVPGCGTSPEPLQLARLGAIVTGIDIAPAAIAWQQAEFASAGLTGTFVLADIASWRPSPPAGILYEQTCLCAISPKTRTDYEAFAFQSLKPGGRLLALFLQTSAKRGGPPYHCDLGDMRALFPAARWQWPAEATVPSPHPNGWMELGYDLKRLP